VPRRETVEPLIRPSVRTGAPPPSGGEGQRAEKSRRVRAPGGPRTGSAQVDGHRLILQHADGVVGLREIHTGYFGKIFRLRTWIVGNHRPNASLRVVGFVTADIPRL